jgi:hypothetical protein
MANERYIYYAVNYYVFDRTPPETFVKADVAYYEASPSFIPTDERFVELIETTQHIDNNFRVIIGGKTSIGEVNFLYAKRISPNRLLSKRS